MRVYHFLNAKYGLEALARQRLRISRITELNDPFEFLGVECAHRDFRWALQRTKRELSDTKGLLCFSKRWQNPVLWGHYAERHKGLCLGFDFAPGLLTKVDYVRERLPQPEHPDLELIRRLLFSKFEHWEYEQEYRAYTSLDEEVGGHYFMHFGRQMKLKEVIVGSESRLSRSDISNALTGVRSRVDVFKARPSFKSFQVVRNKNEALWT